MLKSLDSGRAMERGESSREEEYSFFPQKRGKQTSKLKIEIDAGAA